MKQKKPSWLKVPIEKWGAQFKNLETHEKIFLNPLETTIYKILQECQPNVIHFFLFNRGKDLTGKVKEDNAMLIHCIDWFSMYAPEAYRVLID